MSKDIGHKVAYVKTQGQTRNHHCHWPNCPRSVPPAMWGCTYHWYKLPYSLRQDIWRSFQPGQEVEGTPSKEYVEIARRVQDWILANYPNG